MGTVIVNMFFSRAQVSVAAQRGMQAFYLAESGLEIGARLLTMNSLSGTPSRIACSALTGNAAVTNASLDDGTFTLTTINSSPILAIDTLSAAITATSTSIPVVSTAGFAPSGKIMVDREAMDYGGISGNSFVGVTRGVSGTTASVHANAAPVSQFVCSIAVSAGIPNLTSPQYQRKLQWSVYQDEAWAVGVRLSGSSWNIIHWNYPTAMTWSQQSSSAASPQQLNDISIVSNADAWAVGNSATVLHYNGSSWTALKTGISGSSNILGISALSSQEAWACDASGRVLKWTPTTNWTVATTASAAANAISMIDSNGNGTADAGWVVGNSSMAWRFNGSTWASANTGITTALNDVVTLSSTKAYAVGGSGRIFRWNGTSWSLMTSGTTQTLNGISMITTDSTDIGWAVGNSSVALYYNGSTWTSKNSGITGTITQVVIISANEAWAINTNGGIYYWDGTSWSLKFDSAQSLQGIDTVHLNKQITSGWTQVFG